MVCTRRPRHDKCSPVLRFPQIMYAYYGLCVYTKSLGFLRQPITSLQMVQMVAGVGITASTGCVPAAPRACVCLVRARAPPCPLLPPYSPLQVLALVRA